MNNSELFSVTLKIGISSITSPNDVGIISSHRGLLFASRYIL